MAANLHAAAETLLASFDDIQMSDIAAAAGIARSSLYYYFTSRDDILFYFLRAMLDELAEAAALAANGAGDPPKRLVGVVRAQLDHFNRHPAVTHWLIAQLGRPGRPADMAARIKIGFEEPVCRLLIEGAEDGSLRSLPDAGIGATALFGAVLVMGLRLLLAEGRVAVDKVLDLLGSVFWQRTAPTSDFPLPGLG